MCFSRFVMRKRSEARLISEIKAKYLGDEKDKGKRLCIMHGDYNRTSQMAGCTPAPNIGFKRLLAKHFKVYDINEHKTSKLYNKTRTELVKMRNKQGRRLYEVLTLKEKTEVHTIVNRDCNACKNILNIAKHYILTGQRLIEFCRNNNKPIET